MTLSETAELRIGRLNDILPNARAAWFGLLAYLGFVGIILLGVEDADFFVPTRQTRLPLLGVDIPTSSFFWFAPVLGAVLYVYLHLQLLRLWDALADPDRLFGYRPYRTYFYPWPSGSLAAAFDQVTGPSPPYRSLAGGVSASLVWASGPVALAFFWVRSWPAHDSLLTQVIGACLLASLNVGFVSGWLLRSRLSPGRDFPEVWMDARASSGPSDRPVFYPPAYPPLDCTGAVMFGRDEYYGRVPDPCAPRTAGRRTGGPYARRRMGAPRATFSASDAVSLGAFLLMVAVFVVGDARTRPPRDNKGWPAPAKLSGIEFVPRPADWREYQTARRDFRDTWCGRKDLNGSICGHPSPTAEPAPANLPALRAAWCAEPGRKLSAQECTAHFDALEAEFRTEWNAEWRVILSDLGRVDLSGRDLRGALMPRAFLANANLQAARLDHADLTEASLEGANLSAARLSGADLRRSRLEGASLNQARLDRANLANARLEGASLRAARLEGANLHEARMARVELAGAKMTGADLTEAQLDRASLRRAELNGASLYAARLDGAILYGALMDGAKLDGSRLAGADLREAHLERADLRWMRLDGADLRWARVAGSDCTETAFLATAVQGADLMCRNLTPSQLRYAVGDAATRLPPGLQVQSCLDRRALPEEVQERVKVALDHYPDGVDAFFVSRTEIEGLLFCDPNDPNLMHRDPYPIPPPVGRPH